MEEDGCQQVSARWCWPEEGAGPWGQPVLHQDLPLPLPAGGCEQMVQFSIKWEQVHPGSSTDMRIKQDDWSRSLRHRRGYAMVPADPA